MSFECWMHNNEAKSYGEVPEMRKGDILTMELHCINKSLNFYMNNNADTKFGFENIALQGKTYTMAVSLSYEYDSVELMKYERLST